MAIKLLNFSNYLIFFSKIKFYFLLTNTYFDQILTAFSHTLHILRPTKCPGFSYAWLELVSHRVYIGRMLVVTPQQKGMVTS